jgi:hypothetical protein
MRTVRRVQPTREEALSLPLQISEGDAWKGVSSTAGVVHRFLVRDVPEIVPHDLLPHLTKDKITLGALGWLASETDVALLHREGKIAVKVELGAGIPHDPQTDVDAYAEKVQRKLSGRCRFRDDQVEGRPISLTQLLIDDNPGFSSTVMRKMEQAGGVDLASEAAENQQALMTIAALGQLLHEGKIELTNSGGQTMISATQKK